VDAALHDAGVATFILLHTAVAAVWTPTPPWCLAMVASIGAAVWVRSLYRRHS
jgi:hypothetical protein